MVKEELKSAIIEASIAKDWGTAAKEWACVGIERSDDPSICICGHSPIVNLCYLENTKTKTELIVGNCCVQYFDNIYTGEHAKFFSAIEKHKINRTVIDLAFASGIVNLWECKFLYNVSRKRKFTRKQADCYKVLVEKVFDKIQTNPKHILINGWKK